MALRIVFCGTPQFAVPTLRLLLGQRDFEVLAVVTQPDRPKGRGQEVAASPVKEVAAGQGVRLLQPERIKSEEAERELRTLAPDAIVIVAYGQIVPARLLDIPRLGWVNLHASLLPKYRGAAPIQWAIANGERRTGLTTMRIDAGMDTGEILLQREMDIGPDETAPELAERMAAAGAPLMVETLRKLVAGEIAPRPQDHSQASYAPLLKKEDGRIDWKRPACVIYNRMRGFAPWPAAYTTFRGQMCHVWGKPAAGEATPCAPGVIRSDEKGLRVACGEGTWLAVEFVQLEGRKRITGLEFGRGFHLREGEAFGAAEAPK
jgi:methionyl-tRNA formyltransferase